MNLEELREEFNKLSYVNKIYVAGDVYCLSALFEIKDIIEDEYDIELNEEQLDYIYNYIDRLKESLYDEYYSMDIAEEVSKELKL